MSESRSRSLRKEKALPTAVTFTLKTPKSKKVLTTVSTGGFTPKESEDESDNHVERPKKRKIRRTDHSLYISKEFALTNELSDMDKSKRRTRKHLQLPGSPDFGTSSDGSIRITGKRKSLNRSTNKINNIEDIDSIPATNGKSLKEYDYVNTQNNILKKTRKSNIKKEEPVIDLNLSNKSEARAYRKSTRKMWNSEKNFKMSKTPDKITDNKENVSMNRNSILSHDITADDDISIQKHQLSISSNKNNSHADHYSKSNKRKSFPKTVIASPKDNEQGSISGVTSSDSGTASEYAYHESSKVQMSNTSEDNEEKGNLLKSTENSNFTAINPMSRKGNRRNTIVSNEARIENKKSKEYMKKRMTINSHTSDLPQRDTQFLPFKARKSMRKRWSDGLKNNPEELTNRLDPFKIFENNSTGEQSSRRSTRSSIRDRSLSNAGKSSQVTSETEAQSYPENQSDVLGDTLETNGNNSKIRSSKSSNRKRFSKSGAPNDGGRKSLLNSFDTDTNESSTAEEQSTRRTRSSKLLKSTIGIEEINVDIVEGEKSTFSMEESVDGVKNSELSTSKNESRRLRSSGRSSRSLQKNDITINEEEKHIKSRTRRLRSSGRSSIPFPENDISMNEEEEKATDKDDCVETPAPLTLKNKRRSNFSVEHSIVDSSESEKARKKKENSTFEKTKSVRFSKLSNGSRIKPALESETGTSDDCIIIDDDSKDETSQTLLSESLIYSRGKRRSKSLTFLPYSPENGKINSFNDSSADSSIASDNSSKKTSVRHHGTPHPLRKRRRTYELQESVTERSVLQALSESSSSQAAIEIQLNAPSNKKVRFEHVTIRRAQNSKKTDEEAKTVQLAASVTETSLPQSGKLKKSQSFHRKFLPSTSSTPNVANKLNLAKEVLTRNAKITSEMAKRRSRSAEECGSRVNRTKMPDFAKLHKKAADKMENIMEMKERRAERARLLLSGQRPPPTKDTSSHEVVKKSHRQLMFDKPSVSGVVVREKQDKMASKQTYVAQTSASGKGRNNPLEQKKMEPSKTSRFGFKIGTASATDKNVQIKAVTHKTKLAKDTRAENRTVLKGVRGNRRFELLMKMRQK